MDLTSNQRVILFVACLLAVAGTVAAAVGLVWVGVGAVSVIATLIVGLQLRALRRIDLRRERLEHMERELDIVSRRVISETEAILAEIRRAT